MLCKNSPVTALHPSSNATGMPSHADAALAEPRSIGAHGGANDSDNEVLFRNLVQEHGTRLQRFIVKHIGNATEAEDLAQQAFLEAVKGFDTFQGQAQLSTWLYGIAMNLVRNYLSRAPHRRYEFTDDEELGSLPANELGPNELLEQNQQMHILQEAISELPQSMQDVLLLVAFEEMSYEDAAVLLTVPVGTVRSRLSRARGVLRSKLSERGVALDF
jgi:RNA polymerase sigma factor (sigma-70 family)